MLANWMIPFFTAGIFDERVDWVAGAGFDRGMAGGETFARARVWVHWGYCVGTGRVRAGRLDFHEVGNRSREYVSVFAGGGDGGSGGAGVDCPSVFWKTQRLGGPKFEIENRNSLGLSGSAVLEC